MMPISVPGPASRTRQQGFSLLEVLIVLVIVGIAAGAVSVSALSDTDGRALRQDATRLALLFSVAQAEARKSGNAVVWEYGIEGYAFG
jgi:general secretion pathway protein H